MVQTRGVDGVIEDDAALLHATREGDADAYGRLYERHAGAALVVARQYVDSAADAEDVVHEAFANVHRALLGGGGPEVAFRAYLFTAVRRTATLHRTAGRRAEPTDDLATLEAGAGPVEAAEEPALETFERGIVARAFRSLPERWQAVLWHSEVEGLTPAQIGPILGLSANSTAALAYRAREGLRQAYLQHHLQDPLDEGCKAVAGRLGAHVRGGLGARDTAQVEAHLDGCGECRALVLELGDVNHGMRAVVAPLVLGLLGLGALAHELPVGGGLAAGAASLGTGGQGAAGGGAGASGGAGGGAAAGTAAAPAGAGAAGGAAGLAVAGTAGTTAGGLGALLAGMSGTAVAVAVGAVAVVAAAVVAAVNLFGGEPGPVAATPTVEVSGSTSAATLAPTPAATPSSTPSATPSPTPTPTPTAIPDEPADEGAGTPAVDGGPAPTPTPEPTVDPTPDPEPPTPPALPELTVVAPDAGIALSAGTEQNLVVSIANTGDGVALDLTAEVDLPDGVTFVDVTTGFRVVGTFAPPVVPGWACLQSGASASARCSLDELPPRTTTQLVLRVSIDEGYAQEQSGALSVRVRGAGLSSAPWALPVHVERTGPRLVLVDADRTVDLVAGRPRAMSVEVRNAGGTSTGPGSDGRGAGVDLALPAGSQAVATSDGWACGPTPAGATCWHAAGLAPGARSVLTVDLSGPADATAGSGTFEVALRPARGLPSRFGVPYSVARPAAVVVTAPADARLAAGVRADVPVQVTNDGDLVARDVEVRVDPPAGFTWAGPVGAPAGWSCTAAEGSGSVTCTVPTLAPGAEADVTLTLPATAPTATGPALGELWVRGTASDGPGHEHVGPSRASTTLTAVLPTLTVEDLTVLSAQGSRDATVAFAVTAPAARGGTDPRPVVTGATADVRLPAGVRLDPYPEAPVVGACAATDDPRTVRCELGDLVSDDGGKAVAGASFAVEAGGALSGTVRVTASAPGATDATAGAAVRFGSAGLLPVFAGKGDLEVTEVGAPLLTCLQRSTAPCAAVRDGSQDNNALTMVPLDELASSPAGVPGSRASVPVSSGATLAVPQGRDVVWARLYWSGVRAPGDTWSTSTGTARLRAPDGQWSQVQARERTTSVRDKDGREYYQSAADVTELVRAGGAGEWGVADVAVAATRTDKTPTYYAGWALVVVHGTLAEPADGAPAASAVTVYDGGTWVGSGAATAPEFTFVAEPGSQARVGVVAWEGDRGGSGDLATLGSTPLVPQRWDGTRFVGGGSGQNAFDSTATGSRYLHSLGVDAKGFQPAALSATGVSTLRLTTTSDQYLVGAVTLRTVPRDGTTVPEP